MAPVRGFRPRAFFAALLFVNLMSAAPAAHALRLVDYNLLNYPGSTGATRDPRYVRILTPLGADILCTEEQTSQSGASEFLNSVLNVMEPGQWAAAPFFDYTGDSESELYYKPSKVQFLGTWGFIPNPIKPLRTVNVYRLKPVGYSSAAAEFRVYAVHLKASSGSTNEAQRAAEAHGLRDTLNALPPGVVAIVTGDFNCYRGTEPALDTLSASHAVNVGRLYDPLGDLGLTSWQDNMAIASHWTQSPCASGATCASGAATGGLDDRFDLILATYNARDGEGIDLLAGTYVAVGNDGLHHDLSITDLPTIPEGASYASDLILSSDHLPVRADLMIPARVSASTSPLAFGTVIVGATPPTQSVSVSNPAVAPADTLDYSYSAPAGFSAPAGTIHVLAGNGSLDPISLSTAAPGAFAGNLALASNDLDTPSLAIPLSGTVLAHAAASLDSLAAVTSGTLDFGAHDPGDFADQPARVHNPGFDALHARLSVSGAAITGPDAARFSIAGGFSPALVGGSAALWNVHFDDSGVTGGTTYSATLTFTSADEPLPGAAAQPALTLALRAEVSTGATAVGPDGLPTVTRLYAPYPNPLSGSTVVRFDLARPSPVTLDVFDLSGRRVARIADGEFPPGTQTLHWDGRARDGQPLGAGLYFVRMSGRNVPTASARLAIVR